MFRLSFLLLLCALGTADAERPNILFLFADDQRADMLGPYGNRDVPTPNLDRLAAMGTVFERAYIMGGLQGAVCVPSRAMLMSGRTLFRVNEQLKGHQTWPAHLASAGWATFGTGKWHNGAASFMRTFQRGQAVFLGGMSDQFSAPVQDYEPGETAMTPRRKTTRHTSETFADAAIGFLREKKSPFVCYTAFTAPHDPREAPPEFHQRATASPPGVPANFLPQHPFDNGEMTIRDEKLEQWPRTEEAVRRHLADYRAIIEHMDAQIGRILAALEESGALERTIIVFAGDNGLAIGSHGLFGKQNCYEHSMRVPLIVAGPGLPRGGRSEAMVYLLDLFPTLCELTSQPAPPEVEGRSFAAVLRGTAKTHRERILTAYRGVQRSIRDERWKIINYPQIGRTQLFDLQADPGERTDLATEQPERVTAMLGQLAAMQKELGDDTPLRAAQLKPAEWTAPR